MKKHRLILSLALMASVTVFTGCKEEEVEKPIENTERVDALIAELRALNLKVLGDTLKLQEAAATAESLEAQITELKNKYNQRVTYTLKAVNTQGELLEGAVFTVAQAGEKVSKTTDASGAVVFENMRGGVVTGTVKVDGYSVANFSSTLYKNNDESGEDMNNAYSITSTIPVIPAPGSNKDNEMFTIQGYLYANFSAANDTLTKTIGVNPKEPSRTYDAVKDRKIKAVFDNESWLSTNNNGSDANLLYLSYDNVVYESTIDAATGLFTLKVPATTAYYDSPSMYLLTEEFSHQYEEQYYGNIVDRVFRIDVSNSDNNSQPFSVISSEGTINTAHNAGEIVSTKFFYGINNY